VGYLRSLLLLAIGLMSLAIVVSVVISWLRAAGLRVPYSNPLVRAIEGAADLMLRPIRNAFPTAAGGLDFSPAVALVILQILAMVIRRMPIASP